MTARREYQARWAREKRLRAPDVGRATAARWRRKHPEAVRAQAVARTTAHSAEERRESLARLMEWRTQHPGRRRSAARRDRHRTLRGKWDAAYNARHGERRRASSIVYAEKRRATQGNVTATEWLAICDAWDRRCAYCWQRRPLGMDHVIPLARGGRHAAANVVPACRSCNSRKNARSLVPFLVELAVIA